MNKMNEPIKLTPVGSPESVFNEMKQAFIKKPHIDYETRIDVLSKIEQILVENEDALCEAINKDYGNRSVYETKFSEIGFSLMGIRHTKKHLKKWMKPQKRYISLMFFGAKNTVIPQSKGIVGMVVPWNFPLFITICPLTSVIAAGNRVMIKLATNSQNLCRLLKEKFAEKIPEDIISFLPGVSASEFCDLPYDHLVFTGSPEVGKTVMKKAADYLTPVTLELGGKSPTIIADDFDITTAASRTLLAKFMNSGQICVTADYCFLPEGKEEAFIKAAKEIVSRRYPSLSVQDYTSVIDKKAYQRLLQTLEDAKSKNARVEQLIPGKQADDKLRKIAPTLVLNVNDEMTIMQEEIFGPFLPIKTYKSMDDVIGYINSHDRPLALYLFTNNKQLQERVITNTRSGGVTINDCAMHTIQHDLPFGGTGKSGMGYIHGYEGFLEQSKLRPINKQSKNPTLIEPPFGKSADRAFSFIKKMKWIM